MQRQPLSSIQNHQVVQQSMNQTKTMTTETVYIRQAQSVQPMKRSQSFYTQQTIVQRQQLGNNLDVVCFLMAIENERLINENDKLKYQLKESEDKLLDRMSYEQQIQDLQARLQEMQYQEMMYRTQSERTTTIITTLENEISSLKHKCQIIESDSNSEITQLRQMVQRYSHYETEIRKNRDILDSKDQMLEELRGELNRSNQQKQNSDAKAKDLEMKIGKLVYETERLNNILKQKLEEIEVMRGKISRSESRVSEFSKYEIEYKKLVQVIDLKTQELDDYKYQVAQRDSDIKNYIQIHKQNEDQIRDLQNKTVLLSGEIERFNHILLEKKQHTEEWKFKCTQLEQQNSELRSRVNKVDSLQMKLNDLTESFSECLQSLEDQKRQNNELGAVNSSYQQQNLSLQQDISMLQQEIERLNQILRQKGSELEEVRFQGRGFQQQISDYQNKLSISTKELESLNLIMQQRIEEHQSQSKVISQLQGQLRQQEQQFKVLHSHFEEQKLILERKIHDYESRMTILVTEIDRLNVYIEEVKRSAANDYKERLHEKTQEVECWISKYQRLEGTFQHYRRVEDQLLHYQQRVLLLSIEVERLNGVQIDISEECKQLTTTIEKYQGNLVFKDDQLQKALERNALLQRLVEDERNKRQHYEQDYIALKAYQDKCVGYEQRVQQLSLEISTLSQSLRIKSSELEESRQKFLLIESQMTSLQSLTQRNKEYESKIMLITQENDKQHQFIIQLQKQLEESSQKLMSFESRIQYLTSVNEDYKQQMLSYESLNSQITIYKSKISEYENKIALLSVELERQKGLVSQKSAEFEQQRKYWLTIEERYQHSIKFEDNCRILSAEIDRLNGLLNQQEEELRIWRFQYADSEGHARTNQNLLIQIVLANVEIEALRFRVQEKEREVEEVRRSSLAPYKRN